MSNLREHAKREFWVAGWADKDGRFFDDDGHLVETPFSGSKTQELMCRQVLELLELFSSHGHSGTSAPYAIDLFTRLAKFEPIVPLTGEDWEWHDVGNGTFQNIRCGHVFRSPDCFSGQAYDIDGKVFWEWVTDEETGEKIKRFFTCFESRVPVEFPYMPKTEYIQREHSED